MTNLQIVPQSRLSVISRARKLKAEIEQTFLDANHWNILHPYEASIDADPYGQLAAIKAGIDKMLEAEQPQESLDGDGAAKEYCPKEMTPEQLIEWGRNQVSIPEYMCPNCVTPWKCNGPHIQAEIERK